MRKILFKLFFITTLFVLNIVFAQTDSLSKKESDRILWSSTKKLTWNDFQGAKKFSKFNSVAVTQCEIVITDIKVINGLPSIEIANFFNKNDSWTITNKETDLEHEQLHFDIFELYTRMIRKKFNELNSSGVAQIDEYQKVYDDLIQEAEEMNNKYDNEVYFNLEMQKEWLKKIKNDLNKLKRFELKKQ